MIAKQIYLAAKVHLSPCSVHLEVSTHEQRRAVGAQLEKTLTKILNRKT